MSLLKVRRFTTVRRYCKHTASYHRYGDLETANRYLIRLWVSNDPRVVVVCVILWPTKSVQAVSYFFLVVMAFSLLARILKNVRPFIPRLRLFVLFP